MIFELSIKAGVAMQDTPITPKVADKLKVRRLAVFTSMTPATTKSA